MAVTEVYWWDLSGVIMDHDRDSGTIHAVSLGRASIHYRMIHQGRYTKNYPS